MQSQSSFRLRQSSLSTLPSHIEIPQYDASKVTTGIVHIGVGGFHRSHEAMYVNNYMNQTGDLSWGICGIGLRDADKKMQDTLVSQDYLYSLVEKHPSGERKVSVIGAICDFMMATENPEAVIDKMSSEDVKIVSLTITEGGYNFDPVTGEFIADNPDVLHDIANPTAPKLVFGYLLAALKARKDAGIKPFTIMSCDNIQHNGDVLKAMVLAYINLVDAAFAQWVEENVAFPNSMVDRITPATTQDDIAELASLGIEDTWPVVCEPFHQWVIEDDFCHERPAFEQVGAQFVKHVAPYEKLKLRMLNAGHSVLGLVGSLAGFDTIHGSMENTALRDMLGEFMRAEVKPNLDPVGDMDVNEYGQILLARFANPNIKDALSRICLESSAKIPVFLLPTLNDNLANDGNIDISALVLASWAYYSQFHTSQQGKALEVQDQMADELQSAAKGYSEDKLAFLKVRSIFGDLVENPRFTEVYQGYLSKLHEGVPVLNIVETLAPQVSKAS